MKPGTIHRSIPLSLLRITLLFALLAIGTGCGPAATAAGSFTSAGSLIVPRDAHTATLLGNGRVLIVGGEAGNPFESNTTAGPEGFSRTEIFDPSTSEFSLATESSIARWLHSASLLQDGRVLIAGGCTGDLGYCVPTGRSEIYDPTTGAFSSRIDPMIVPRFLHSATVLRDGRVLIVGGAASATTAQHLSEAELFDPASGAFIQTGSMRTGRAGQTSTLLPDGRVLIAGGSDGASPVSTAELYEPVTGTFSATGSMATPRYMATATMLDGGEVLVVGGQDSSGAPVASAELYDPETGAFKATGSMASPRASATATMLRDGRVLVAGGSLNSRSLASAELYDPKTGEFSATGAMGVPRSSFTATLLLDNRVLMVGGYDISALGSAEFYQPPVPR